MYKARASAKRAIAKRPAKLWNRRESPGPGQEIKRQVHRQVTNARKVIKNHNLAEEPQIKSVIDNPIASLTGHHGYGSLPQRVVRDERFHVRNAAFLALRHEVLELCNKSTTVTRPTPPIDN